MKERMLVPTACLSRVFSSIANKFKIPTLVGKLPDPPNSGLNLRNQRAKNPEAEEAVQAL